MNLVFRVAVTVVAVATVSSCASVRYCMGEHDYQIAQSVPQFEGTAELNVPSSQGALTVPKKIDGGLPYGRLVENDKGDIRAVCLDQPPRLKELEVDSKSAPDAS